MNTLLVLLLILIVLYGVAGVVLALMEAKKTDTPLNWKAIVLWLPKMLGIKV